MKKLILCKIMIAAIFENEQDTLFKKEFDGWKAAGVTYFFVSYAGLVVSPSLNLGIDKYLHRAVGYVSGVTANLFIYKKTKNKVLGFLGGCLVSSALGYAKELSDRHLQTGVYSKKDFWATALPGAFGSIGATIVIGCKRKKEPCKRYI